LAKKRENSTIMAQNTAPEQGGITSPLEQHNALVVEQPKKLEGLLEMIDTLNSISERLGEDRSGDMGGAGGRAVQQGGATGTSQRDQAIANLPAPTVMRQELKKHIEKEVRTLQKEIQRSARRIAKPGAAYHQNMLYARIRRLNALLASIIETSIEMVQRLFIRVFIDKQQVI